jgi:hypothetical protein
MSQGERDSGASVEDRLRRISRRIEGLRTGRIPLSQPVLRRQGNHFWVENDRREEIEEE